MKKITKKRWARVGYCFLTATFIVSFMWAHKALMLSEQEQLFLNGYVTCVKHGQQAKQPLTEKTVLLLPNGAIEATSLEDPTARHRDQLTQGLYIYAD